jgi:hypothetical protein
VRGHTDRFAQAVRKSHVAVARVDVISDDKVVAQLDVHGGEVTRDRTRSNPTDFEIDVVDRDGTLTPEDMTSLLSPGTRLQLWRGVRLEDVDLRVQVNSTTEGWSVSNLSTGVMNSVTTNSGGELTLGP